MSRKQVKRTYNVKTYHCKFCGHIFHTANPKQKKTCEYCGGELEIIDKYKSRRPPRGSGKRDKRQVKGGVDKSRGKVNRYLNC